MLIDDGDLNLGDADAGLLVQMSAATINRSVCNKAAIWVFEALEYVIARFPFPIVGIDSDNGSEFINHHLFNYCQTNKITFTRSRSPARCDTPRAFVNPPNGEN